MLGDGGLPDALGEGGCLGVPHAHVDVPGIERASGHAHLPHTDNYVNQLMGAAMARAIFCRAKTSLRLNNTNEQ